MAIDNYLFAINGNWMDTFIIYDLVMVHDMDDWIVIFVDIFNRINPLVGINDEIISRREIQITNSWRYCRETIPTINVDYISTFIFLFFLKT